MPQDVELVSQLQDHRFIETCFELADESHFWFKWRFEAFLQQLIELKIPLQSSTLALDVGAGTGVVREQVEGSTSWTVDITDLDHGALLSSKKGRGKTFYYDILEKRTDWQEKYDVILLFDVLEHIEKTEGFIEALLFHLKPGGYLFLNVPALPLLFSRYDEVQGHFRRYKVKTLEAEFADAPVKILDTRYWGWMNIPLLLVRRMWLSYFSKNKSDEEVYRRGFSPPGKTVNAVFLKMMQLELTLPRQNVGGSSILLAARKNA